MLADLCACLGFYTRLPLPARAPFAQDFAAAQWAAPLAGGVIGGALALLMAACLALGLPPGPAAALTLGASLLLTGALHEDGAADVADGFGGGATRERKLLIMKDSRIGTYGVAALALVLLARFAALSALAEGGFAAGLLAAHAGARALLPGFMAWVPPARAEGVSARIGRVPARAACGAGLLGLAALGLAALGLGGPAFAFAAALSLALWCLVLRRLCLRQIGGQTGDVLGALEQGGEVIVLFAACLFPA